MSIAGLPGLPGGRAPFLTLAAADRVRTESVAWGMEQTLRTALDALREG